MVFNFYLTDASSLPSGIIVMWSGASTSIPTGWLLCNGSNNTPDLRNRFIVGAGSSYSVGATGGEATHTLTIDEMPSHSHELDATTTTSGSTLNGVYINVRNKGLTFTTDSTGSGSAHENRPPYYALCFIMKQ